MRRTPVARPWARRCGLAGLVLALLAPVAGAAGAAGAAEPGPAWTPGEVHQLTVEMPEVLRQLAGPGAAGAVRQARVAVAVPPGFDPGRAWPILLVNATSDPGHNDSRALLAAYRLAAAAAGWVIVAADPEPAVDQGDDRLTLRYALARAALAALAQQWPAADAAPLALAGFSGGAKYSGWLAALFARQGRRPAGVFLAGVNQEPLGAAARQLGVLDAGFRQLPVFLQGGATDPVATPAQHRRVRADLLDAGFRRVRLEFVPGGHAVDAQFLQAALEWFEASSRATAAP